MGSRAPEGEGSNLLDHDPHEKAMANGWTVVEPGPRELFIDLDSEEDRNRFEARLHRARANGMEILVRRDGPSPSGEKHRSHVVLEMDHDLTPEHRIAWQAALGSDPMRELLSLVRIRKGIPHPTVFFEKLEVEDG